MLDSENAVLTMPPKHDPEPIPKLKIPEYSATATEASSGRV